MTGKRYQGFDFELQSLEGRTMMTAVPLTIAEVAINGGTQLRITGTSAADLIALQRTVDGLVVTNTGGFSATYTGTYVNIKIVAGNGNDSVLVDSSVTEKCIVIGGKGNDMLSGGAGNDSLFGNAGIDKLYGNEGDDVLVSVGGGNDTVTGGNGNDSFWTDNSIKESITDADLTETAEGAVHKIGSFRSLAGTAVSKEITGSTTKLKDPKTTSSSFKYHSFADRPLFADNGPSIDDIKQGQVGDCYFLATIASIAKVDAMKIRQSICDLGDGTYAVQFKSKGVSTYVRVDNDLATYNWSATTPAYANLAQNGSMWVPIMEKAFTFFRTNKGTYASISSGFMTEVYTDFGVSSSTTTPSGSPNAAAFVDSIKSLLDAGKSLTAAVYTVPAGANLVSGHAYTIDSVVDNGDGTYSVKVRNPWGMDGYSSTDGSDDGYVTLSANQAFAALAYVTSATV